MPKPRRKPNGVWTLIVCYQRQRRQLTLGRTTKGEADLFAAQVDILTDHKKHGGATIPAPLQSWLESIAEKHRQALSDIGLFGFRSNNITLADLFSAYLADYSPPAESTRRKVESTINNRFKKLDPLKLSDVEPKQHSIRTNSTPIWSPESRQHLQEFSNWQRNFLAPATWTRDNKLLSSIGIWAVANGYCDFNPFAGLPTSSMVNDERNEYISIESAIDAMDSCLLQDTRLTIAMGRFCGLRTCSEVRTMKWEHVDFDAETLTIIDSKKKKPRIMPLFDTAKSELERQFELTGSTRWVCSEQMRSSTSSTNYSRIKKAVSRSGQEVWPRLRQNLRSSCENDLLEQFPERLVVQWIGHTISVSRSHYQKLRSSDYTTAVESARKAGILK